MSSQQAKQYHSINIGNKNTWDNWHLVPTSRPLVNPPQVKTHYVDLPGSHGSIDLTEVLTDHVVYTSRQGEWEFYVINSGQVVYNSSYAAWYNRYSEIMEYVHGQELRVVLDDDPAFYYKGRLSVNNWQSNKGNSVITINYLLEPYKKQIYDTGDDWLWDPFNFETDIIRSYKNLPIKNGTIVEYVLTTTISDIPIITCSNTGMSVVFQGTTYQLKRGKNIMNGMNFVTGTNRLTFSGSGRVTIEATGGLL